MITLDINYKYCKFPDSYETNDLYTCRSDEKCCDVGCCLYNSYKFHKFWYYWLIMFLVFAILSACSWFYKKSSPEPQSASRCVRNCNTRRCTNDVYRGEDSYPSYLTARTVDSEIAFDQLIVQFRNRNSMTTGISNSYDQPPPAYNSLTWKLSKETDSINDGPPPRYSSLFNLHRQEADNESDHDSTRLTNGANSNASSAEPRDHSSEGSNDRSG